MIWPSPTNLLPLGILRPQIRCLPISLSPAGERPERAQGERSVAWEVNIFVTKVTGESCKLSTRTRLILGRALDLSPSDLKPQDPSRPLPRTPTTFSPFSYCYLSLSWL
jgi:hypothetical protein